MGGFVEGTQSSTFLLVTVDQGISPCQPASGTLGEATHPLYAVIEATVFWKGQKHYVVSFYHKQRCHSLIFFWD